jgi:hypothetical protein
MGLSWSPGVQSDLKQLSVGKFLNIRAEIIDKDDGMPSSQSIPPGRKPRNGRSPRKLLGENVNRRHHIQYRVA